MLRYAIFDAPRRSESVIHTVDYEEVVAVALAVARYDGEESVYLFYCDPEWVVITDTLHESEAAADEQARLEFPGVKFVAR